MTVDIESPAQIGDLLRSVEYVPDENITNVLFLALRLQRPILVEGPPGCGKTELARSFAKAAQTELIRLQCYRGLRAENAMYEWDYMKQFLKVRIVGEFEEDVDPAEIEDSLFEEEYLLERPVLKAIRRGSDSVLLIDEIDRAGEDFEAFLLEVLDEYQLSIPELGTIRADTPPLVILTSNRTRRIGDALKRRCLYIYLDHPTIEKELEIVRTKVPSLDEKLARQVVEFMQSIRYEDHLLRTPGISETVDWAVSLSAIGASTLEADTVKRTLTTVLKEPQDVDSINESEITDILESIVE